MFNLIVLHLLRAIFLLVARIFPQKEPPAEQLAQGREKRILLVATTAIGDTLMCSPAIRAVRQARPQARIVAMVDRRRTELLASNPYIDDFIIHPGKFKKLISLIKRLRRERFDLVIILHANDPDSVPLVYLSGAPVRVGWAESRFAFLLTRPVPKRNPPGHYIDLRGDFLAAAGIPMPSRKMDLFLPPSAETEAAQFFQQVNLASSDNLIGFHPFGSYPAKCWPMDPARDFLARVINETDCRIIIFGGKQEKTSAEELAAAFPDRVISACGRLSVMGAAGVLKHCRAIVTTDSGPMHLALALGLPTVALFGPASPDMFGGLDSVAPFFPLIVPLDCPRPCQIKVCRRHDCMRLLTPEMVMSAFRKITSSPHAPGISPPAE
ncbi:MAG: glycosyltransferase family 9 protein [Deltaproteobacteria bacterium]|nr:glycosyltransferase family 9 protein [Deltaproteobacteria bacterium]